VYYGGAFASMKRDHVFGVKNNPFRTYETPVSEASIDFTRARAHARTQTCARARVCCVYTGLL